MKVVRSIDLGFGFTKFTVGVNKEGFPKMTSFPSIVSTASANKLGSDYLNDRNTINVIHNEIEYEVGEDVILNTNAYTRRILNRNYTETDEYAILMKGALKMMRLEEIDVLAIGVPVNQYEVNKEKLKKKWTGIIELDADKKVNIKSVVCLPQPIGGFANYGADKGVYQLIKNQRNLIVDPGYFTFDWLLTDNMKPMEGSGSYEGGMSFVIEEIIKRLGLDYNNPESISRLDRRLYKNHPFIQNGKEVDVTPYLPFGLMVTEKAVKTMLTKITDTNNIDNIIMIGGAAKFYKDAMQKHLKDREIKLAKGGPFSNAFGYQLIAEKR